MAKKARHRKKAMPYQLTNLTCNKIFNYTSKVQQKKLKKKSHVMNGHLT